MKSKKYVLQNPHTGSENISLIHNQIDYASSNTAKKKTTESRINR